MFSCINYCLCYSTPKGLEDVSTYPALFAELIKTGQWEIEDLKKLAGLNFLRVLKAVEKVRLHYTYCNFVHATCRKLLL